MNNFLSTKNFSNTRLHDPVVRSVTPSLSLIIPVYNEEHTIEPFFTQIGEVLKGYSGKVELVFVNDGSSDNTSINIAKFGNKIPNVKLVNLSRNFGKEAAVTAGIDISQGEVIVPIDVDLQDPPSLILKMIDKWAEGYDVVFARRVSRNTDSFLKRNSAGLFYKIFNYVSDTYLPENVGDFRLMDRKVVEAIKTLPENNRFMKGLFAWVGFTSATIDYERPSRSTGTSKWNFWKLWNFALDGIFSFSTVPLRIWSYIGALISLASFFYIAFLVIRVLVQGIDLPGYASIMTVILFFGGIQLLSVGIIGEYIGRIFLETKNRPIYIIESILESEEKT